MWSDTATGERLVILHRRGDTVPWNRGTLTSGGMSATSIHLLLTGCPQVRGDRHGGLGPAADGLPLPEHQALCGEFPAHGGQAAGVQGTRPAGPGNQLGETP